MKKVMLLVCFVWVIGPALLAGGLENPFYAMDTNVWSWQGRTAEQVAGLLAELGYDGYGHGGTKQIPEYTAALKKQGLGIFNTYVGINIDSDKYSTEYEQVIRQFEGTGAMLWVFVTSKKYKRLAQDGDEAAVKVLRDLADYAHGYGVKIALYPHTSFYVETVGDAVRVSEKVNRRNLGVTFNLCHHLKVVGQADIEKHMIAAMPHLFQVTINGADSGETTKMNWNRLIQPLDVGTYDVYGFVKKLHELGYKGPIGMQGYGIKGDVKENLKRTIEAWKKIKRKVSSEK